MNKHRFLFSVIFVLALMVGVSYGQPEGRMQVEPSYEVTLQLVIGSNDAVGKGDMPQSLSTISRQLKSSFTFSNYRVGGTLLGRVSNTGNFEYKSVTNVFGEETDARSQSFLEWSMGNFRNMPTAKGSQGFQAQSFRFGARIPLTSGSFKDESGKINPVVNYESIGLSFHKVGLPENVPTLIGTLNLPGANGTIFLVMTVRAADL